MRVEKYEATGNDFLVVCALDGELSPDDRAAAALCDRHRGVGADGVITLERSLGDADVVMKLRNADGGFAEMSGNGVRCLAAAAVRAGLAHGRTLAVSTDAGERQVRLDLEDGVLVGAEVSMGAPIFDPDRIPVVADSPFGLTAQCHGVSYDGDAVGMGNPHFVLFVDDPASARVTSHGPRLERDERFSGRTNVGFVRVDARDRMSVRVWERGVGETLSCGTGACAAVAAASRRGLVDDQVAVSVRGGVLLVGVGDEISLAGPVRHCFDLDVDPDDLIAAGAGS